jgi:hypothetical protein
MMTRCLVFAALLTGAVPGAAFAQEPVTARELTSAVARLASLIRPENSPLAVRFATAVRWLQNNAPKTDVASVSREYVASLERAAKVLETHGQGLASVFEDVTRELEAKVQHCRALGVGMGGAVALKVNTRRGGSVVGDWQVQYLLKFDEWLKTPPRTFPRVSSPTDARVEPGRYWIWARDPVSGRTSGRMLVEVAGRADMLVDLPVP